MGKYAGKYMRHAAAVLVSGLLTLLLDRLPVIETYVSADQLAFGEQAIIGVVTFVGMLLWGIGYAWLEKWLKRYHFLDPEGAEDRRMARAARMVGTP